MVYINKTPTSSYGIGVFSSASGIYLITSPALQFKIRQNISMVTVLIGLLCLSR